MPTRDSAPIGAPCWFDLMSADLAESRRFYGELLGWTADEPNEEFGGYTNFRHDGAWVGGLMGRTPDFQGPDVWSVYLATDDARKTADSAAAGGGQVLVPAMDVGDLGTMAVVSDPGGAVIGMWQPREHPGFKTYDEPGAPSWFELHTRDYAAVLSFYRDVFRWDTQQVSDTDEFRYTTVQHGEESLAGVMDSSAFLPEGMPSHWAVYFGVADVDASVATVTKLGGTVIQPAEDTPYGRIATANDSTGATFRLRGPNVSMPGGPAKA
jgi:predicted enzyme related to lactoylglutathione lyase